MLKSALALLALAGVAFAAPAVAQGIYFEAPGVSVGVGERPYHRGYWGWDNPRHYSYGIRTYDDDYAYARCTTKRIYRTDGSVRTIRRCR